MREKEEKTFTQTEAHTNCKEGLTEAMNPLTAGFIIFVRQFY